MSNKMKVIVVLAKEERYDGDLYSPIGVVYSEDKIFDVLKNYFNELCLNYDDDYINTIVDDLCYNNMYDDWDYSDIAFKIETTFIYK